MTLGTVIAICGAAICATLAGIGSAYGVRIGGQAAAGVVAANLAAWVSGIHDGASVKTVAINAGAVVISAVLAALMNMEPQCEETDAEE